MPSFFIDRRVPPDGRHVVHDRSRCPPQRFPAAGDAEYLGELLHAPQALLLARLKYPRAHGCPWCATEVHAPVVA